MRIGDRVLLVVAMLLCIASCAVLFAVVWGFMPMARVVELLLHVTSAWYYRIGVSALLLLLIIGFTKLMFVRSSARKPSIEEGIPITPSGDVRITADAIRDMCAEVVRQDRRLTLNGCTVEHTPQQGLIIGIRAQCRGDENIPAIVDELKQNIVKTLQHACSLNALKVNVLVEKAEITVPAAAPVIADAAPTPTAEEEHNG